MFNNNSTKIKNKRTVKELLEQEKIQKIVFIDVAKEFKEATASIKTNNYTDPINALEHYKP